MHSNSTAQGHAHARARSRGGEHYEYDIMLSDRVILGVGRTVLSCAGCSP